MVRNLIRLLVEGIVVGGLYLVVGRAIRKAGYKLGENAVIGWIDDRIGEALGITAPTISQVLNFIGDWGVPLALVAGLMWGYHQINKRNPNQDLALPKLFGAGAVSIWRWLKIRVEPSHIIIFGLVIALAGAIWGHLRQPKLAQLEQNIATLTQERDRAIADLAKRSTPAGPQEAKSDDAPKIKRALTEKEIQIRRRAVTEINTVLAERVRPAIVELKRIESGGLGRFLETLGPPKVAEQVNAANDQLKKGYEELDEALLRYKPYQDIINITDQWGRRTLSRATSNYSEVLRIMPESEPQWQRINVSEFARQRRGEWSNAVKEADVWYMEITSKLATKAQELEQ